MRRVPKLHPDKTLFFLRDETLVVQRNDPQGRYSVIRNPAPADLAIIVEAVDGKRTLEEICAKVDAFEAPSVVHIIESLDGVVFQLAEPARPKLVAQPITIVGRGQLPVRLARALHHVTSAPVRLLWTGADPPGEVASGVTIEPVVRSELAARLAEQRVVIAAHSGVPLAEAIEVNRAALKAGVTCVHVLADPGTLVIGPSTVPFKTVCLECSQINWYFENHRADHASEALHRLHIPEIEDRQLAETLVGAAAGRLAQELTALTSGTPYPSLLGSVIRLSLAEGTRVIELVPTTNCESCHGCNRRGIQRGVRADQIPEVPPLDRTRPLVADKTGGVRSVELLEAHRRARVAMAALGVEMTARGYSKKVEARYPGLQDLPFVAIDPELSYRADAPHIIARAPQPCFGKGAIPEQCMASGMFEFLERTLQMYQGGVEVVRARYAEVRDHAINMEHFTHGVLDVPDRGPRVDFHPDIEIDWCWARCLRRDRPILVPAHALFPGIFETTDRFPTFTFRGAHIEMPRCGSSGLSAGATREDSVLQGMYEVLEHDARLIQCRSGVPAPAIDPDSIDEPMTRALLEVVDRAGFDLILRYVSRDIAVPVVEAFLTSRKDLTFFRVPGWGAHHDPAIAIRRAVTEAAQCIGAVESVASQTFRYGMYSITNSFHESRYCVDRTEGTIAFGELPRPDPSWSSAAQYLQAAVDSIVRVLPDVDICFFDYPSTGLEGVHVTRLFATHLVRNLHQTHIVQDRLRDAYRAAGRGDRRLELSDLYLGELKI